jgi:hypothetical protein
VIASMERSGGGKHGEPYKKKSFGAMREYLPLKLTKVTTGEAWKIQAVRVSGSESDCLTH